MVFWTFALAILAAFLLPCVAVFISDMEHEASKKKIVVLHNAISKSNKEKEDLMRKSKAQSSDILNVSDELSELKGDMYEILDEFDYVEDS